MREIVQAATALGYSPEATEHVAPPSLHWEKLGYVTIKKTGSKIGLMRNIAVEIVKARQREAQAAETKKEKR